MLGAVRNSSGPVFFAPLAWSVYFNALPDGADRDAQIRAFLLRNARSYVGRGTPREPDENDWLRSRT